MKRILSISVVVFVFLLVFCGCGGIGGTDKRELSFRTESRLDTANLFFSGIMNHEAGTFYDYATGEILDFEVAQDKIREVRNRFSRAARDSYYELYCYVRGNVVRDTVTAKEKLFVNNAYSFKRNASEKKPPIPGAYYSTNTENIYSLTMTDRYEYVLYRDEAVVSEGSWGKVYDYTGVLMPDDNASPIVEFTLMYQLRNIYITMVYDDTYIIFQ